MTQGGSNKKVANKLVAASCAAVLAVYTAGYARTQKAVDRLAAQIASERKAERPAAQRATLPHTKISTTPIVPPEALSPITPAPPRPKVDREPAHIATTAAGSSGARNVTGRSGHGVKSSGCRTSTRSDRRRFPGGLTG